MWVRVKYFDGLAGFTTAPSVEETFPGYRLKVRLRPHAAVRCYVEWGNHRETVRSAAVA